MDQAAHIHVIDGDTIRQGTTRIRLLGFDTPETHYAKCEAERRLGALAAARLKALIASGPATIEDSGRRDIYDRMLAVLKVGGPRRRRHHDRRRLRAALRRRPARKLVRGRTNEKGRRPVRASG